MQHDFALINIENVAIGEELVNPNADPGALHLDSNFQPDCDYGLTHTIYAEEKTYHCSRYAQRYGRLATESLCMAAVYRKHLS